MELARLNLYHDLTNLKRLWVGQSHSGFRRMVMQTAENILILMWIKPAVCSSDWLAEG
jgi:hypothetical protein